MSFNIVLPSKPKIIKEEANHGVYEIDGLYPGYGHTLGNSLRRVILSSIPGVAITSISIDGVKHEFSTIDGVREDVISIILNLKKVNFVLNDDNPCTLSIKAKGPKVIDSSYITGGSQVEVVEKDQYLFEISENKEVNIEFTIEKGLGYVPRELAAKNKAEVGTIYLDAAYTPIRRVSYEVENMRVGDRTDYNRLKLSIETDGTISPKDTLESSIKTMINQLQSIIGFREFSLQEDETDINPNDKELIDNHMNSKLDMLGISTRTLNTLVASGINTIAELIAKTEDEIKQVEGMGAKGVTEIVESLGNISLKLK